MDGMMMAYFERMSEIAVGYNKLSGSSMKFVDDISENPILPEKLQKCWQDHQRPIAGSTTP
jgi:hypothetical protein